MGRGVGGGGGEKARNWPCIWTLYTTWGKQASISFWCPHFYCSWSFLSPLFLFQSEFPPPIPSILPFPTGWEVMLQTEKMQSRHTLSQACHLVRILNMHMVVCVNRTPSPFQYILFKCVINAWEKHLNQSWSDKKM